MSLGAAPTFVLGQPVVVQGKYAIVRFLGPTKFARGDWVGVEFLEPSTKLLPFPPVAWMHVCRGWMGAWV